MLSLVVAWLGCLGVAHGQSVAEWPDFKLEASENEWLMSGTLDFEVSRSLEDAMNRGVALYFVAQADVYRDRWYFYDKRLAHVERHFRLSYLPLSRRWRLNVSNEAFSLAGLGVNAGQSFDTMEDALVVVRRISQWQIAPRADFEADGKTYLNFKFRLDLSQLPRPLQMGTATQNDWAIEVNKIIRLSAAVVK
jgi:hypothetical protein